MEERSRIRKATDALAGVVLGAVLLVAAAAKVLHPAALEGQIVSEGLGGVIPPMILAVLVLAVEAGLGAALLLGVRHPLVVWPTAALSLAFLLLTGRTYYRDLTGTLPEASGCGCFGYLVERTPAEAFWSDLALLALPLLAIAWARRPLPREIPRVRFGLAGVLALATAVLAWKAPVLPVDDWATRLGPGTKLAELCAGKDPRTCLVDVVPELGEDRYWVVLDDLGDDLVAAIPALNQGALAHEAEWGFYLLTSRSQGDADQLLWTAGPAFPIRAEVPAALMAPLYRTLPRSFEVVDGRVTRTVAGWPPWMEGSP